MRKLLTAAISLAFLGACSTSEDTTVDDPQGSAPVADRQTPLSVSSTWQWQLQGALDRSYEVDVYDIDLFDSGQSTIEALHADDRIVICYFSAGSFEDWRQDATDVASDAMGHPLDGFPDERWLDVRHSTVRTMVERRLDVAVEIGCDGVEPDNMDGYTNSTGFDLSGDDQLDFNRFVAVAAHDRGLLVGLKNDLDQIPELASEYDFAVNEQCHEFDECEVYEPFTVQGKPVFNAEYDQQYTEHPDEICERSLELGLRTLILPLDLDNSFRISCDD
ncbi:MAG: endo alpha-1,4 polygalactosaminidase [Acidimicrobiales bacterium]